MDFPRILEWEVGFDCVIEFGDGRAKAPAFFSHHLLSAIASRKRERAIISVESYFGKPQTCFQQVSLKTYCEPRKSLSGSGENKKWEVIEGGAF